MVVKYLKSVYQKRNKNYGNKEYHKDCFTVYLFCVV